MSPRRRRPAPSLSLEATLREMIRSEVEAQLKPFQASLGESQRGMSDLVVLRQLATQLSPLVRRGPGRPPGVTRRGKAGRELARQRACAIIGCKRTSRTKGYCSAHYQKLRMLERTRRRPSAWADFASPASVADLVLPRGRAAHRSKRSEA